MGSSAGRRDGPYVAYRDHLKATRPPCAIHSGPWCTGIGLTVDHVPAMHTVGGHLVWEAMRRQGRAWWQPACKPCQDRQGADIRNRTIPPPTWTF